MIQMTEAAVRKIFFKVGVKIFVIFTGRHLCRILFLIKLQPANLLKKRFKKNWFLVNTVKFLRLSFFIEHVQ